MHDDETLLDNADTPPFTTEQLPLPPGTLLQEYHVDQILGQGGFGITYRACDTLLERDVAIKEYMPQSLGARRNHRLTVMQTPGQEDLFQWGMQRFFDEAKILAKLKHFNIVRINRLFKAYGTAYFVMDFEKGDDFSAYLRHQKEQISEDQLLSLTLAILDGLAAVHDQGFLHRDIKPANIFIRQDGVPLLIDFGSTRQVLEEKNSLTTVLTHGYSPLEQYTAKNSKQGPWSDIYALGATLYKAITGRAPVKSIDRSMAILDGEKDPFKPLN
ncbi:serine/threonine protein kinase [Magnetococcales bacterium HHB-1]